MRAPDTSQDAAAIQWNKTGKGGKDVLDGKLLTGSVKVVSGLVGTGAGLAGELGRGLFGKK